VLSATELGTKPHKNPKLSTPLYLLSMNVKQETSRPAVAEAVRPPAGFSTETLPKPLQDAIHAGQMHITKNGEVQVYIEVTSIDPQSLDELRSYGVTVQIIGQPKPDKAKGEVLSAVPTVQALLPVTMIDQVAALPFVRYMRLPDYGFTSTGSVDTQGDSILKADIARQQFGVDGTGVRVGVISGGIGGIFATGCTACGPTTAIPSPISSDDLPTATGTRNSSGILTSVSGGIIAQSFPSSSPDLEDHLQPDGPAGVNAEGTAMLEIVHDLAPGAQLYFANAADGASLSFEQAVNFLAANTDVVVDDISFFAPPFDGTNAVSANTATDLNTDTNPIRGYFTAVGNYARQHYQGQYVDSGVDLASVLPTGYDGDLHLFQPVPGQTSDIYHLGPCLSDPILVGPGESVQVFLTWDDPFTGSSNDYDLWLVELPASWASLPPCNVSGGTIVASSLNPQTGTQNPVEHLIYNAPSSPFTPTWFGILVQNAANLAMPRTFDMFIYQTPRFPLPPVANGTQEIHNYNTISGSVPAESDAGGSPVSVVSVGATDAQTDASGDQPATIIEPFSGQGPTEPTPQLASRMKPDITATDGVSVTGAGGFGLNGSLASSPPCALGNTPCTFFGTSAAAPHAAAIAALVLQAAPCLLSSSSVNTSATDRANLRNFLTSTAMPLPGIAQAVPNNIEGWGLLDALAAVSGTLPVVNAGSSQTVNATSATGAAVSLSGSATDPDSCPVTLTWAGSCGTASGASASLMCPIGNDTETLTASNSGVKTSLPSSTVQITVSDFTIAGPPSGQSVPPGQPATYTISVGQQFGAFTNPVTLSCSGLPSLTSCSFSQPSVTPGSGTATSTLTISTTAPSSVFPFIEPRTPNMPIYVLWLALLFVVAVLTVFARRSERKRCSAFATCALLICLVAPILSCGGGSSGPHNPGTPAGTYSVTVTGTSNQLQHSATVTLTVQ
jgi:hypothetical protein